MISLGELAKLVGGELAGDADVTVESVSAATVGGRRTVVFFESAEKFVAIEAGCYLVPPDFVAETSVPFIRVRHPKLAFAKVAGVLHKPVFSGFDEATKFECGAGSLIAPDAVVGDGSVIGENVVVLHGARIGRNVRIGDKSVIHPNVVIYDNVTIGSGVTLHAGAVIGADGFGFVRDGADGYVKFPQIGTVTIADDVEIGALTCVDRGALGETFIGRGTKIDNLVQIAHNVRIGERVVIAAQTGISGSTVIEDDCVIGGQVGFGDHAHVRRGAVIGSQAGVLPGKIVREGVWWGTPIQPLDDFKRQNAHLKTIGKLKEEVRELRRIVDDLLRSSSPTHQAPEE